MDIEDLTSCTTHMDQFNAKGLDCLSKVLESDHDACEAFHRLHYGRRLEEIPFSSNLRSAADSLDVDLQGYVYPSISEDTRETRWVNIGAIQFKTPGSSSSSIKEQRSAIHSTARNIVDLAGQCGVNVLCLQEVWHMPFAFCTREKVPWCEFAEDAKNGPSTLMLSELAKKYNMVIVNSFLERDEVSDIMWNAAVIINQDGEVIGKSRKNHIPRVGDFNESTYYVEGNLGHPVFQTPYGRIAVNICYGRHHPLNWLMYGLNGAEIVFNPCATVAPLAEHMWPIEARCAAIANNYFTVAINRVGTETYPREFTSGDGKPAHHDLGYFFGSSYITGPEGTRTPGLSRVRNGLLVARVDLNSCRQSRDALSLRMTQRLDLYVKSLAEHAKEMGYKI
ncbi:unnamed protein product [Calicophoron daubneyi]|uniref:Beta-ureidopropionase n=1 Tax=Calicophoron daubneyi TaxID=300641 RepID=A0AAV2TGN0_CALDB